MKDFDNIEDWYREELNNYNVDPDKGSWESISDDLDANMTLTDDNISEWYKREVSKLEERPDYTVWEKLATKLDTASVWDKLVVSLNRYDQMIWWRNTIVKGSAILLLLFGSYQVYNEYFGNDFSSDGISSTEVLNDKSLPGDQTALNNSNTRTIGAKNMDNASSTGNAIGGTSLLNKNESNSGVAGNNNSSELNEKSATSDAFAANGQRNQLASNSGSATSNTSNNKKRLGTEGNNEFLSMERVPSKNANLTNRIFNKNNSRELAIGNRRQITEEDISHTFAKSDFLVKKEKNKIVFNSKRFSSYFTYGLYARRFYVGINIGVKKQGLITQINKQGLLANAGQTDYLDFGHNFGMTGGYILSDKVNLESNLNVISTSGYQRRFNTEGYSTEEELNLSYTTVNLLAKKMNTKSTFDNKVYSTNLIGGVYVSYLHSSSSKFQGGSYENNTFNAMDYGFVLGIEQDRYLTKSLIITPGFRYNQGISNVFANDNAFNYGYNFSFEFNIGLKYIFLKKSK